MIECDGPKLRSERSSVQTCLTSVWLQQYAQDFSLERERERGCPRVGEAGTRSMYCEVWVWPPVYRARREDSEKGGGEGGMLFRDTCNLVLRDQVPTSHTCYLLLSYFTDGAHFIS